MSDSAETAVFNGRIGRLVLDRTMEGLTLLIVGLPASGGERVAVRFRGVRNMRFRSEVTELSELPVVMATDISDRGWEDIRFEVRDTEEEVFSFYCREYERIPDGRALVAEQ